MLTVTSFYGGVLALLYLTLTWRVITMRRSKKLSLSDGGDTDMRRRIRAHGNAAENIPIGLILLALCEMQGAPVIALHLLGVCLTAGRMLHGIALSRSAPWPIGRIFGMLLTLTMQGVSAVGLVLHSVF